MLPKRYRFTVQNTTGQTSGAITINGLRKKFDSNGAISFESSEAAFFTVASLATATYSNGTSIDNSADKYLGGDFELEVTFGAVTPSGDIVVYLQRSTDGTNFDTDGLGDVVCVMNWTAGSLTRRVTFEL